MAAMGVTSPATSRSAPGQAVGAVEGSPPVSGVAKRRRAQRLRQTAKQVKWLVGMVQMSSSHHTSPFPPFSAVLDEVASLKAEVTHLRALVAALQHPTSTPPASEPSVLVQQGEDAPGEEAAGDGTSQVHTSADSARAAVPGHHGGECTRPPAASRQTEVSTTPVDQDVDDSASASCPGGAAGGDHLQIASSYESQYTALLDEDEVQEEIEIIMSGPVPSGSQNRLLAALFAREDVLRHGHARQS